MQYIDRGRTATVEPDSNSYYITELHIRQVLIYLKNYIGT